MKKKYLLLLLGFIGFSSALQAQTELFFQFPPKVGDADLQLNTVVQDLNGVDMRIDHFNYYLSNIHIIHDGGQDLDLSDTVLLVTATDFGFYMGNYNITNVEEISFGVGVPQDVNHLDISLYPENHPLSWQSPSMHWGWTSGYKFMLCDGYGDDNNSGNPDELFQLHCLGNANYKNVNMAVVPTVNGNQTTVVINCNLDEWLYGVHPGTIGVHHGSTGVNTNVMNSVDNRPVFELPQNAGVTNLEDNGTVAYTFGMNSVKINWEDVVNASSYRLISTNGKEIESGQLNGTSGALEVSNLSSGIYVFYMLSEDLQPVQVLKIVR